MSHNPAESPGAGSPWTGWVLALSLSLSLMLTGTQAAPAQTPNAADHYTLALKQAHLDEIHEEDVDFVLGNGYRPKVSLDQCLDDNQTAFNELRQGLKIDHCRFVPDVGVLDKTPFGPYPDLQSLSVLFFADGLRQYSKGHADDGLDTMLGAIKIGEQIQQDRVFAARSKGLELQSACFLALFKWLQREDPSANVLKKHIPVTLHLAQLHVPFSQTILADRDWTEASTVDLAAAGNSRAFAGLKATQEGQVLASFKRQANAVYAELLRGAAGTQFDSMSRTEVMVLKEHEIDKKTALTPDVIATVLLQQLLPSFSRAWEDDEIGQVELSALPALLALKAWHFSHQAYPAALTAMVPGYLAALPHDPCGVGPLKYRAAGHGCILYSVGPDHHDDGGKATLTDYGHYKGKDIVMKLP